MTIDVAILGVFVADLSFRADRLPNIGETLLGNSFISGPGGKGSNQAVAVARAGAKAAMIAKLGQDTFADLAKDTWEQDGVINESIISETPTGAAMIYIDENSGNNAIIIVPGSGGAITVSDIESKKDTITSAKVFMTQLEQPADVALKALEIAKENNIITIINPAPATKGIDVKFYQFSDYVTPNEIEAEGLTGIKVTDLDSAKKAASKLIEMGATSAIITLGEQGALLHNNEVSKLVPSYNAGKVVETTGAGDSFNGALAVALSEGKDDLTAVKFACAAASLSVTKPGTSPSMPMRSDIDKLLNVN